MRLLIWSAALTIGGCNAQDNKAKDNKEDKIAIEVVRNFYNAHQAVWGSRLDPLVLDRKLDSIASAYCTKRLQAEAKSWSTDGQDLFTDSWIMNIVGGIDVREVNPSIFLISFQTVSSIPNSTEKTKKRIELRIGVVKQTGGIKLDTVTPLDE